MTIDLLTILEQAGIDRLHQGPREISGACPQHVQRTGHYDSHPSWSINRTTMLHFCQSCHYKGTLSQLLTDLTGAAPEDLEIALKEQGFLRTMERIGRQPEQTLDEVVPDISDWILANQMGDVPQRLLDFKLLTRFAIDAYGVRWDTGGRRWVLPIRTPSGELLGAQYRQKGVVLTLPEGMQKSETLFGYSVMSHYDYVALVESPLDAVRLFSLGIPAISSLGSWISAAQIRLMARAFSVVYMALDNDKAGHEGAEMATRALRVHGAAVVPWRYEHLRCRSGRRAKDVGDVASNRALLGSWRRTQRWGL